MRAWAALAVVLTTSLLILAQEPAVTVRNATEQTAPAAASKSSKLLPGKRVIPAGTRIPMQLKNAVSTKSARVGDRVYAETTFPVALDNRILIPVGTYVQGRISSLQRAGRVKGRAEVLFHFTMMVFPSGYTVSLPGSVERADSEKSQVSDPEGTIRHEGEKGKDAAEVGKSAAQGAAIGAIATRGARGAGIGGGIGAATGLAIGLLSRGGDVTLESGTSMEMVLQRDVLVDESRIR
ncbi:MAG TPA: hypothetical protein VD837_07430 [Terriglobales bacterium]|nr:hypothetical protein [Terriglobales bacterium]